MAETTAKKKLHTYEVVVNFTGSTTAAVMAETPEQAAELLRNYPFASEKDDKRVTIDLNNFFSLDEWDVEPEAELAEYQFDEEED